MEVVVVSILDWESNAIDSGGSKLPSLRFWVTAFLGGVSWRKRADQFFVTFSIHDGTCKEKDNDQRN